MRDRQRPEPFRHERVERAILDELRSLLQGEVSDPALGGAWIVDVWVSPDGKNARASYAVRSTGDEAGRPGASGDASASQRATDPDLATGRPQVADVARVTKEAFSRAAGFLRARIAGSLNLKRTPQLSFTFIGLMLPDRESEGASE